jgi:hypothetical protein
MSVIIPYDKIVSTERQKLQKGMNYRCNSNYSVFLMSMRENAPFKDEVVADGRVLIYEGHNVHKNYTDQDPYLVNQPRFTPKGSLTENGKFEKAALDFKEGYKEPEIIRVYEKIKAGIWSFNGIFKLMDVYEKQEIKRSVFKFILILTDKTVEDFKLENEIKEHARMIPSHVKVEVWARDKGQCTECGSSDHLHFDHIVPYTKGGTSLSAENIQLLCARHNLQKSDRII